jgi:hypothetical protein
MDDERYGLPTLKLLLHKNRKMQIYIVGGFNVKKLGAWAKIQNLEMVLKNCFIKKRKSKKL